MEACNYTPLIEFYIIYAHTKDNHRGHRGGTDIVVILATLRQGDVHEKISMRRRQVHKNIIKAL